MRLRPAVGALAAIASALPAAAVPQSPVSPKALSIDAVSHLKHLAGLTGAVAISRDGAWLVASICRATDQRSSKDTFGREAPSAAFGCQLVLRDRATGRDDTLTTATENAWAPALAPEGRRLAFLSDRPGRPTLEVVSLDSRAVRELGPAKSIQTPVWVNDRELIYLALPDSGADSLPPPPDPGSARTRKLVFRSGQPAVAAGDTGAGRPTVLRPSMYRATVILADVDGGRQVVLHRNVDVFPLHLRVPPVSVSPDARWAAYYVFKGFVTATSFETRFDVYVVALDGRSRPRRVAANIPVGVQGGPLAWSPDGERVAWTSDDEKTGHVFVYRVGTDTARALPGDPRDVQYGGMTLSPVLRGPSAIWLDNRRIVTTAYQGAATTPWWQRIPTQVVVLDAERGVVVQRIDVGRDGVASFVGHIDDAVFLMVADSTHMHTLRRVDVRRRRITSVLEFPRSTIEYDDSNLPRVDELGAYFYYVGQDFAHPATLYRRSLTTGAVETLMDPNPTLGSYALGSSRLLFYRTSTGASRKAALFLPPVWTPGRRVPLVAMVYPCMCMSELVDHFAGDQGGVGDIGSNVHLFTTRGYAVLMPDVTVASGTAMADIEREVSAGVDAAIRDGYADSARLGVTGHSYGGYSTYALLVQSARYRAGVVQAGFVSWTSSYLDLSDEGGAHGILQAEASPAGPGRTLWENRQGYLDNSPLFFLDRIHAPVLIVQGTIDGAINQNEARMAFQGLRRLGRDAELVLYDGEGHGMSDWSISNLRDFGTRMLAWFDRYLCPDRASDVACPAAPLH